MCVVVSFVYLHVCLCMVSLEVSNELLHGTIDFGYGIPNQKRNSKDDIFELKWLT